MMNLSKFGFVNILLYAIHTIIIMTDVYTKVCSQIIYNNYYFQFDIHLLHWQKMKLTVMCVALSSLLGTFIWHLKARIL